jgi:hypothetical protein
MSTSTGAIFPGARPAAGKLRFRTHRYLSRDDGLVAALPEGQSQLQHRDPDACMGGGGACMVHNAHTTARGAIALTHVVTAQSRHRYTAVLS